MKSRNLGIATIATAMLGCGSGIVEMDTSNIVLVLADGFEFNNQKVYSIKELEISIDKASVEVPGIVITSCSSEELVQQLTSRLEFKSVYMIEGNRCMD